MLYPTELRALAAATITLASREGTRTYRHASRRGGNLDNLPVDVALLVIGLSNTSSAFGPLPLGLATSGMPGCTLNTSIDIATLVVGSSGRAEDMLAIPYDPLLVGAHFYEQALVLDPVANPFGAVMSDAAAAVVGDR